MNLIERAKNIILKPKDEWDVISQETTSVNQLITGYLLILALIPAGAAFIKFGLIGTYTAFLGHVSVGFTFGIGQAVVSYITSVGGAVLSAFVIDALAPSFSSQKNMVRAMQLVVFSYTPMMLAGIFQIIPGLGFLGLVGLYGLYLLYLGLTPLMQTPEDKKVGYLVVSILITIVIYIILGVILGGLLSVFVSTGYGLTGFR
jgi:hypothetical protein